MPRVVDHDERRREIALIVEDLIAEMGVEAVTIRDVARRAGYSTMAICHYFGTKQELFAFTSREARLRANRRLLAAFEGGADFVTCLAQVLPTNRQQRNEWHTWFGFWGMAAGDPRLRAERHASLVTAREIFRKLIRSAKQRGELDRSVDAGRMTTHLSIALNGIASLVMLDAARWPAKKQIAELRRQIAWAIGRDR